MLLSGCSEAIRMSAGRRSRTKRSAPSSVEQPPSVRRNAKSSMTFSTLAQCAFVKSWCPAPRSTSCPPICPRKAVEEVLEAPHSRYPVIGRSADDVIGFVHIRDLLHPAISGATTPIADLVRPVVTLPDSVPILRALSELRRTANHLAVVLDEYGGSAGIVTLENLVERLVGEISDEYDIPEPASDTPSDIDGLTALDEFADQTGYMLPQGPYTTVAGFFMAQLEEVPNVGDRIVVDVEEASDDGPRRVRLEFWVTEMDGRRAARFAIRQPAHNQPNEPTPDPETPQGDDHTG